MEENRVAIDRDYLHIIPALGMIRIMRDLGIDRGRNRLRRVHMHCTPAATRSLSPSFFLSFFLSFSISFSILLCFVARLHTHTYENIAKGSKQSNPYRSDT